MGYIFGVDAGGSRTVCAAADERGQLVSVGYGGPANYKLVGTDTAAKSIKAALEHACMRANLSMQQLQTGFFAVSGLDNTIDDENIINHFIAEMGLNCRYSVENDTIASLILGTADGIGIVLICGTGSNCVAVNSQRQRLQVGGLGREFGDFCGGREIALQAMAASMRGHDGRGPATVLYDLIIDYLGTANLADFSPILHQAGRSYPVANLVPLVFQAARLQDAVARDILEYNGRELALSASVAVKKMFAGAGAVDVVLTGGVFEEDKERILIQALQDHLDALADAEINYIFPEGDPVLGALIKALNMHGIPLNNDIRGQLIKAYQDMNTLHGVI